MDRLNISAAGRDLTNALISLLKKSKHARIINVSSGLGSLTLNADPSGPLAIRKMLFAYSSSKAALDMMTVQFANELKSAGIKVNSANAGYTATDSN